MKFVSDEEYRQLCILRDLAIAVTPLYLRQELLAGSRSIVDGNIQVDVARFLQTNYVDEYEATKVEP